MGVSGFLPGRKYAKKSLTSTKLNTANTAVQTPVLIVIMRSFWRMERELYTYVP